MNIQQNVTPEMVEDFFRLFVNRSAYTLQSKRPHPASGRYYYFKPKIAAGTDGGLTDAVVRQHLEGEITLGLYAINPATQRSKWIAMDADYENALQDLLKLQWGLEQDGIEAALERSRRGGHLWILAATPLLACDCRLYLHHLALREGVPLKGSGSAEGIEVFPRQDVVEPEAFGNSIRAPLGVHRAVKRRFFFYRADYTLEAQFAYLNRLHKLTEAELARLTVNLPPPAPSVPSTAVKILSSAYTYAGNGFRILDHVQPVRKDRRNHWARCPSCALRGKDRSGDNLAISVEDPRKYKCWAGCTKEMIRDALGCPIQFH